MPLADRPCQPCHAGQAPLLPDALRLLAAEVPQWTLVDNRQLEREVALGDFRSALALVVAVGEAAEQAGHHPDLELSWGRVGFRLSTHDIGGLSEADFILAARIDRLIEACAAHTGPGS